MKSPWKAGLVVLMLSTLLFAYEKPFIFGVDVSMLYESKGSVGDSTMMV